MIQINPLKSYIDGGVRAALTTPPSASLVFDLPGKAIWVKGVKLKGTDHTYTFSHDNYITLTNTPDSNESEDIKIGVNTSALKNAIDTTYGVVSTTTNGLAPKFTSGNKLAATAATTYYFLGWTGTTLKWYQTPFRNIRINSETTDCLGVNNTDPLIISSGNGISVTWDSTNKKIIITNTKPDVNHNTDTKVALSVTTLDKNYAVILKGNDSNEGSITTVNFSTYLKFNPYTKQLTINGTAVSLTGHTHNSITIPVCSSLNENSDVFSVEYAGGDNSVVTKPNGVDAFGVIKLRTAAGWYGLILISAYAASGIYYRNALSLSSSVGWVKLLDSNNFRDYAAAKSHTHSYLPLAGGTMTLGGGLKFHADENYFGTNLDARIISLLDGNGTTCDGGLIIDERCTSNGTEYVTELLRIRDAEFKWKGLNILHSGNSSVTKSGQTITVTINGTSQSLTNSTYNFSGTSFTSGNYNTAEHNANNITSNGVWYYTSNGPITSLGASTNDGALYSQAYNSNWVGQIAQDYRDGDLFTRGKNNGTWTAWKRVAYANDIPTVTNYYWANIKVSSTSSTTTSPTFATATTTTSITTPLVTSSSVLTLNGVSGVYLKYNNSDGAAIILSNTYFKPFDTANNKLSLGTSSARWSNVCSVLGNFTGLISTDTLKITNTSATAHITFSRNNYNYIVAPAGGSIGFCVNGSTIGSANCEIVILDGTIFPGTTNVTSLGSTSYYWTSVYSQGFYKNGSNNNYALMGGGGHKNISNVLNTAFYKRVATVNGSGWDMAGTNSNTAFTIYAPTTAGTNNLILKSTSGIPIWINQSDLSVGNADTVDLYHATSAGSLFYKYEVTATIPASSITGDFWYATITFSRNYVYELTKSLIDASYSNRQGLVYLNTYEYNGAWYAFTTNYNGCNIKGIALKTQNNPIYYVKLAKPTTYNNTIPNGIITVYSPYNCTITVSSIAPSGVTFTNITVPGFTNLKANSASMADLATTATYASNVGTAGTAGINYVTASKVIATCNWYDTMIGSDTDTVINRWSEIVAFVANFKETPDLATYLSNNYLAKSGGTMTGPLKWANDTALPVSASPKYFVCIDEFANGGTTKYASKTSTLKALTGLTSTAIGDSDEPVYWNGTTFVKANAYPTKSSWNYDDIYSKKYYYSLPPKKCVKISYSNNSPVIISACRTNGGGLFLLVGLGYGADGWTRNQFRCLIPSSNFTWKLSADSCTVELYHNTSSSGNAEIKVITTGNIVFTETNTLSGSADTKRFACFDELTWENIESKPATATRWPSWNEVTGKPDAYPIATKLQTARMLWGQPFDGTSNVNGHITMNGEYALKAYMPRKKEGGGGWAYEPFMILDATNNDFAHIGIYGDSNILNFIYIGSNLYSSNKNLRIYPDGKVYTGGNMEATKFVSNVTTGTSPLTVSSTTLCSNLNADLLDGYHATCGTNKPWGTIPVITTGGYMDVGRHFEFHYDNTTGSDYSTLLGCTGNYSNKVYLPSASGTLALTSQIPNVTNYYWANIKISNTSNSNTAPTFGSATINTRLYIASSTLTKTSPTSLQLVINGPNLDRSVTPELKDWPGIGFHMPGRTWGSLIFNGNITAINSDYSGYINYYGEGFRKNGSSNSYVLLGGGGHKLISDFATTAQGIGTVISINKSLTPTTSWVDTGIKTDSATFPEGNGSYIVQISIPSSSGTDGWGDLYTGYFSLYTGTDSSTEDEILLHGASHSLVKRIYLKTKATAKTDGTMHFYIASEKAFSAARTINFKFRKLI